MLYIPENASPVSTMELNYVGQETNIECMEGFEFTDTPEAYTAPLDNIVPLGETLYRMNVSIVCC